MPDLNVSSSDFKAVRSSGGAESLRRYGRVLREHWKLVVACIIVCLLAAGAYVELATKKYTATAQMLINPIPVGDNSYLNALPLLHTSGVPVTDTLNGASLIRTTPVAAAAAKQLGLKERPATLLATVSAVPIGASSLVAITAESSSALRAQRVANAFVTATVRTRAATLHAQLRTVIPTLKAEFASETPAQQSASGLAAQISALQQLAASNDPTITPASYAELPTSPSSPKRKLALIAGFVVGLLIGIAAAFGVDALDPRLRREDQIGDVVGFRVLARIPNNKRYIRGRRRPGPMLPGDLPPAAREGYRVLRMVLEGGARPPSTRTTSRTYLMTGCTPSEGKTTSAINLAASLAQSGVRVLLLELDMRRPMLSRTLGLKVVNGTEHVLTGRVPLTDALTFTQSGEPFEVLAVKSPQPHLADGLSFDALEPLLDEARRIADYVVIDSPPLTSVIDALPVVNEVDAVVIVARLGVSPLVRLSRLRELLVGQDAPVAGVVLIGESQRNMPAYYSATPGLSVIDGPIEATEEVRLGSGATRRE